MSISRAKGLVLPIIISTFAKEILVRRLTISAKGHLLKMSWRVLLGRGLSIFYSRLLLLSHIFYYLIIRFPFIYPSVNLVKRKASIDSFQLF